MYLSHTQFLEEYLSMKIILMDIAAITINFCEYFDWNHLFYRKKLMKKLLADNILTFWPIVLKKIRKSISKFKLTLAWLRKVNKYIRNFTGLFSTRFTFKPDNISVEFIKGIKCKK